MSWNNYFIATTRVPPPHTSVSPHLCLPTPLSSRSAHGTSEDNSVQIPPLGKTALVWGLFLGVSANIRYQVSEKA